MSYILVIDQGTHASRAILFSPGGELVEKAEASISLHQLSHTEIEQDTDEILDSIFRCLDKLDRDKLRQAFCCCITTQRSTTVAWRADTGEALHSALSWQDRRSLEDLQQFQHQEKEIKSITGLPLSPHYAVGKCRWLLQHNNRVKQALADNQLRLGTLASFLLFKLVDAEPHLIDHSNANRSLLFDLEKMNWSPYLFSLFDLPVSCFPGCVPMIYHYGRLTGYHIPVTAVSGDQSAALHAQGKLEAGSAIINVGTGAFILAPCDKPITASPLLCGISLSTEQDQEYLLEGTVNGAGASLSWAEKHYPVKNLFEQLPEWLEAIDTPPLFINTIGGLGSPWWKSARPAYFIGDEKSTLEARYVAIVESIVFLIMHNISEMRNHIDLHRLKISGGLSRLDMLCQKLSDLSGLSIERLGEPEATARGAAWLAAGCPENWNRQTVSDCFHPCTNPGLKRRFEQFSGEIHAI